MAILFLSILLCAAVFLIILMLTPLETIGQPEKRKRFLAGFNLKENPESEKEQKINIARKGSISKDVFLNQSSEVEKLNTKLNKTKEINLRLEEELALAKCNETAARGELNKLQLGIEKDKSAQENYKKEMYELKDRLVKKDQEYEKEFSLNLNLNKELNEYKQRCENLSIENRKYCEKLKLQEAHMKAYQEELKKQNQIMLELNKRNEENQWVSKKEYEALERRFLKEKEDDHKGQ